MKSFNKTISKMDVAPSSLQCDNDKLELSEDISTCAFTLRGMLNPDLYMVRPVITNDALIEPCLKMMVAQAT